MGGRGRIPIEWPVRSLGTCAEAVLRRVGHRRYRGVRCRGTQFDSEQDGVRGCRPGRLMAHYTAIAGASAGILNTGSR